MTDFPPPGPLLPVLARWLARWIAPYLPFRALAEELAHYRPPKPPVPPSFTFRTRFEPAPESPDMPLVKVFLPTATIPPADDPDIARQEIRGAVDDVPFEPIPVPLSEEETTLELPLKLKVGSRLAGSFDRVDGSPNENRSGAVFDLTITEDLDRTPPLAPGGFSMAFRTAFEDVPAAAAGPQDPAPADQAPTPPADAAVDADPAPPADDTPLVTEAGQQAGGATLPVDQEPPAPDPDAGPSPLEAEAAQAQDPLANSTGTPEGAGEDTAEHPDPDLEKNRDDDDEDPDA